MVRLFQGPLRPGERNAYVPGLRTNPKNRTRAARTIQSYWRRKKASRNMVSRSRTTVTKAVSKALANYGENKYKGYSDYCKTPVPKPSGTQPISYVFYNTSNDISSSIPEFTTPMNLFNYQQGDDGNDRNGNYMYIRGSTLNFEIQMIPTAGETSDPPSAQPQVDFRVMLVKANQKYTAFTRFRNPSISLFLDNENKEFGYEIPTASVFEYMRLPINKKNWIVYRDSRFTLNTPVLEASATGLPNSIHNNALSTKNTKKSFRCKLPVWKKTHFNNSPQANLNIPDDLDTQWLLIIQACYTSHCYQETAWPRNYRVNMLGTTTARDS